MSSNAYDDVNVLDSLTAQKSTYLENETLAEVTGGDVTNPD